MRKTLLALLILAALLLNPTAAFAQDDSPLVPCGDLADADCDMLKQSRETMMGLSSYASTIGFEGNLNNVPGLPAELGLSVLSDGRFQLNPDLAVRMAELQSTDPQDALATMQELLGLMADLYTDTSFDLTIDLGLSTDLAKLISAQAGARIPNELHLPMRMVDGFLYLNVDDIGRFLKEPAFQGWLGLDLAGAMAQGMEQSLKQLEKSDMLNEPAMGALANNVQMNQALQQAAKDHVSVERLDDATLDGVDVAQFRYTFDLASFVSSPEFLEMLSTQLETQLQMQESLGQGAPPMSKDDLQAVEEMLPMLAPMLLSGVEWETVSSIGLEDLYLYQTETRVDWDLSTLASMAAAMSSGKAKRPQRGLESATFTLEMHTTNSAFDEEMEITAPEDALIIPLDEMQTLPVM